MRVTDLLAGDGFIIVNKAIAKEYGLNEAIMLGELCAEYNYWDNQGKLEDGWFYSTLDNVQSNTTLSYKQQKRAIENLGDIVRTELRGMPARRYFYIDCTKLLNKFGQNGETSLAESTQQDCPKVPINNNKAKIIEKSNKQQTVFGCLNVEEIEIIYEKAIDPNELIDTVDDELEHKETEVKNMFAYVKAVGKATGNWRE